MTHRALLVALVAIATASSACRREEASPPPDVVCSDAFFWQIEDALPTGDGRGHGPDIGSDEWKSVVEFRLGVRGDPGVPSRDSDAWCRHVDALLRAGGGPSTASDADTDPASRTTGPSFDCATVAHGSIEAMVCEDEALAALDRALAAAYVAASAEAIDEQPPRLAAEQRGWIKGREECWKSRNPYRCVHDAYTKRIAELQARYRLVASAGPVRFMCNAEPGDELVVTYFETDPPSLIAERGDSVSLMYREPSASGTRYAGRNERFWEHQGEATIVWGHDAPETRCTKVPASG